MTLATTVLDHAQAGHFDEIRELFAPELRGYVTPDTLRASWDAAVTPLGQVTAIGAEQQGQGPGVMLSRTPVQFEHGTLLVTIATTGEWIVGIQLDQPHGTPAAYWLSVRDYHPVDEAAQLTVPILIVNGGRDYQVTLADDLALWRNGLAGHTNVTIEVFASGNHLLAAGDGPSTAAEYQALHHVAPEVIDLIARWISAVATGLQPAGLWP